MTVYLPADGAGLPAEDLTNATPATLLPPGNPDPVVEWFRSIGRIGRELIDARGGQPDLAARLAQLIADLVAAAPETLDTLAELANALGDDADLAATLTTAIGEKLAITSNLSDLDDPATARSNLGITAANTPIQDAGGLFTATQVEAALAELADRIVANGSSGRELGHATRTTNFQTTSATAEAVTGLSVTPTDPIGTRPLAVHVQIPLVKNDTASMGASVYLFQDDTQVAAWPMLNADLGVLDVTVEHLTADEGSQPVFDVRASRGFLQTGTVTLVAESITQGMSVTILER